MGTRHLTTVVKNGEYKVAQYGQWDGYPSGQGVTVCKFLQKEMDRAKFEKALSECRFISGDERRSKWVECGADPNSDMVTMDVSNRFKESFPELHRDTGAEILGLIQDARKRELENDLDFAYDGLMCEWVYVLNMDNDTLEIHKGFSKEPLEDGDRFNDKPPKEHSCDTKYYAVRPWRNFPFSDATPELMESLEKEDRDGAESA